MNPRAVVFWIFGAGVGYLISDIKGAVLAALICISISWLAEIWDR